MAEILSLEQLRERHISRMGEGLGREYHELWKEVVWLHAKWKQYRQLYATSPERIALLNEVAGHFFGVVQDTLYDDILLHLARLTDPPKNNLTIQRLPKLAPHTLASEVKKLVEAAADACKSVNLSRDKRIAHRDRMRALAGTFEPPPSRAEIETALAAVRAVLDCLEMHYWQSDAGCQHFFPEGGEASSLVFYLRKGVRAEEQRMERLRQGKPLSEDLEPDEEV